MAQLPKSPVYDCWEKVVMTLWFRSQSASKSNNVSVNTGLMPVIGDEVPPPRAWQAKTASHFDRGTSIGLPGCLRDSRIAADVF
jgi:hypothetical protein